MDNYLCTVDFFYCEKKKILEAKYQFSRIEGHKNIDIKIIGVIVLYL